jgi:hypothetical protein
VLYKDDGQSTILTLVNDAGSVPNYKMTARLSATEGDGPQIVLYSRQIASTSEGAALNIEFPPLSKIQVPDSKTATNHWSLKGLELVYGQPNEDNFVTNEYTNFDILDAGVGNSYQQLLPWKIERTYGTLIAGASSTITIVLATNSSPAITNKWFLDVNNPLVITNSPNNGVLGTRINGIYPLQIPPNNSYEVTFTLGPLLAGQSVDFNLLNDKQILETNLNHQIVSQASSSQADSQSPSNSKSADSVK